MSEFHQFLQALKQPEYVHVLLNPLPVYATAMGVLGLVIALFMRSRPAQVLALIIVVCGCGSVWPVIEYGEGGYDRVYAMSNKDAQQWLDVHMHRAQHAQYAFYAIAILAVVTMLALWKLPKFATRLAVLTLAGAILCLGLGAWIGHAGGQVRHSEFRDGPPPE